MNAMIRPISEVDVSSIETIEAKLDGLRGSLDETKEDVRELRADVKSIRGEMNSGFATVRESIAELRATMKTAFWAMSVVGMLATIFFTAGKALHWF